MRLGLAQVQEHKAPPDAEADGVEAVVGGAKVADARHPRRLPQPPVPAVHPAAGQTRTSSLNTTQMDTFLFAFLRRLPAPHIAAMQEQCNSLSKAYRTGQTPPSSPQRLPAPCPIDRSTQLRLRGWYQSLGAGRVV